MMYNHVHMEKPHLFLRPEVPDRIRVVDFELRSGLRDVVAEFVLSDGQTVFLGRGNVVEFQGKPPDGFVGINVECGVGADVAYRIGIKGARRVFERLDPLSLVVHPEETPVKENIRRTLLAFYRSVTPEHLQEIADDVVDDAADDALEFMDDFGEMEPGPGHYELPPEPLEEAPGAGTPSPKDGGPEPTREAIGPAPERKRKPDGSRSAKIQNDIGEGASAPAEAPNAEESE